MKGLLMISIVFVVVSISVGSHADPSFRCGRHLISVGDSKFETLSKCGSPTLREFVGAGTDPAPEGPLRNQERIIEEWTYNCGWGRFVYTLVFGGSRLISITSNGYGFGDSNCSGQ